MHDTATLFFLSNDLEIAHLVRRALEVSGFCVRLFRSESNLLRDAHKKPPSLCLLDTGDTDAFEICGQIRRDPRLAITPVILLTANRDEGYHIKALEVGCDACLSKPFSTRELIARVNAVMRCHEQTLAPAVLNIGDIKIDTASMSLAVRGKAVVVTTTEFRLLEYLAHHPGRVFTREELIDAVWHETVFVTQRVVDVYVRRLRQKIEEDPHRPEYIRTMRGTGYRFQLPKGFG